MARRLQIAHWNTLGAPLVVTGVIANKNRVDLNIDPTVAIMSTDGTNLLRNALLYK